MLAKEYDLNFLSLINNSCLQAEVFQMPALNKHLTVVRQLTDSSKPFS